MIASDLIHLGGLMTFLVVHLASSNTVELQSHNIDDILNHHELVLVNFYADWCRFSQLLKPVYEETAQKIAKEYPQPGKVALGKVDCDKETAIAQKYQVSKYPTLKLFRYGQQIKREYRGQRSVDAMTNFIKDQLKDPVIRIGNLEELEELDTKKRHLIGYFNSDDGVDYQTFLKVGSMLRDDCQSYAVIGEAAEKERMTGNKLVFRPSGELATDMLYAGPLQDYNLLLKWATDKCVPLVREITFENAEELTEEGLPFMILFHHIDDTETPEKFRRIVAKELVSEKNSINFLTANGEKFSHPLYHLGKTVQDLPILCIDSFRHMYLWKHDPKTELETPGLLKQFALDLYSGKLHREFHHGPDPTPKATETPNGEDGSEENNEGAVAVGHHEEHGNDMQFKIQQQVIIHSNGVRMQVIRFVQVGKQQPVGLQQQLSALNINELFHNGRDDDDDKDDDEEDDDDTVTEDEHDSAKESEKSLFDKVSQFFAGDKSKDEDNQDEEKTEIDKEPEEEEEEPKINDGSEQEARPAGHHGARHHGNRHHRNKHHKDQTTTTTPEGTTKSITKVTEIKMKVTDDNLKKDDNSPPESIFRKLAPSRDRYTILRDEL